MSDSCGARIQELRDLGYMADVLGEDGNGDVVLAIVWNDDGR